MLYREIIAVCSQIHTKHINTLCGQNLELLNVKVAVHIVTTGLQRVKSLLYKPVLMLYREIMAVCSQVHTKHINTLRERNVELLNVKLVVHIVTTFFIYLSCQLSLTTVYCSHNLPACFRIFFYFLITNFSILCSFQITVYLYPLYICIYCIPLILPFPEPNR